MITFTHKGDWADTIKFLRQDSSSKIDEVLHNTGETGVKALSEASPVLTGRLASSWSYKIKRKRGNITIEWHNDDIEDGDNVALLVQYGHRTSGGYFIRGRDYINPAIRPIFDELAETVWKEVTR